MRPEDLGTYYESILAKEARKEGGIYYTPPLIVDYMVEHSLSALLKGKTPDEITKIKIVDPACGGGIFLLRVYQFLLDWHEKCLGKLTLKKRHNILTDNIFGVDIDPSAVEITKYCLSMRCSEGKDCFLDLDKNIRSGDSLLETEFCWQKEFLHVFKQGGFDIVIGNPPYRMLRADGRTLSKLYADQGYETYTGYGNIYCLFYERGWQLLKEGGHLCFITSNKWMRAGYGEKMRKLFAEKTNPLLLLDFAGTKIFESATVDVNILLFAKEENQHQTAARIIRDVSELKTEAEPQSLDCAARFAQSKDCGSAWIILSPIEQRIKAKIENVGVPLKDWNICTYIGICTGRNEAFVIDGVKREAILRNCKTGEERVRTEKLIRPLLRGRDIRRYHYQFADQWLIATLPVRGYDINEYPAVKDYLTDYGIEKLETTGQPGARKKAKNKWFQLQDAVAYWKKFSEDKIVWTDIATEPSFVNVKEEFFLLNTCSMIIGAPHYIVGILNSKLIKWYFPKIASDLGEGTARYIRSFVVQLPILQVSDAMNERLSQLLARRLNAENVDDKIDALVYELYGLTKKETEFIKNHEIEFRLSDEIR